MTKAKEYSNEHSEYRDAGTLGRWVREGEGPRFLNIGLDKKTHPIYVRILEAAEDEEWRGGCVVVHTGFPGPHSFGKNTRVYAKSGTALSPAEKELEKLVEQASVRIENAEVEYNIMGPVMAFLLKSGAGEDEDECWDLAGKLVYDSIASCYTDEKMAERQAERRQAR